MKCFLAFVGALILLGGCSSTPDRNFYAQDTPNQRVYDASYPEYADKRIPPWQHYNVETEYVIQDRDITSSHGGKPGYHRVCALNCNQPTCNFNPYPPSPQFKNLMAKN